MGCFNNLYCPRRVQSAVSQMNVQDLQELMQNPAALEEVREEEEREKGDLRCTVIASFALVCVAPVQMMPQ